MLDDEVKSYFQEFNSFQFMLVHIFFTHSFSYHGGGETSLKVFTTLTISSYIR